MDCNQVVESNIFNAPTNRVWMIYKEIDGGIGHICLSGRLDVRTVPKIEAKFAVAAEGRSLIVDLSGVELMNSVGLGMLITHANMLRAAGRSMVLLSPSPRVEKVVRIAGLDILLLPIVFDMPSALRIIRNAVI